MPHQISGKHLGRSTGQRNALRRTMITQLFQHERIVTTRAKAQAIRGAAEHMITQAKRTIGHPDPARGVYVRRLLAGRLDDKAMVKKLFDELAPRYAERPGGYTRIFRLGPRKGDAAEMVVLELVDRPAEEEKKGPVANVAGRARGLFSRLRRTQASETKTEKPAEETKESNE